MTCAEVVDAAPQFALDILDPPARSDVAAHLLRCPACRDTVSGMQESAAALLDLDGADWTRPMLEPSPVAGCIDRCGPAHPARSRRRRVRLVVTMATAAMLMVASAFGPELEASNHRPSAPLARAPLVTGEETVGYVNFYPGHTPTLDLEVEAPAVKGPVYCETVGTDGTIDRLGSFGLYDGRGYWSLNRPLDLGRLSSLVLVDEHGSLLASASLTPGPGSLQPSSSSKARATAG